MAPWLAVFIGGGLGALCRLGIGKLFSNTDLPIATLFANLISCAIFGLTLTLIASKGYSSAWVKPLVIIGFCGGLSTFSTFSYETFELMKSGNLVFAILNVFISTSLCMGILYAFLKNVG